MKKVEELGHDVWLDLEDLPAASPWRDEIARAIEQRDVFLFALTPASASSPETRKELEHAQKLRKRIVPEVLSDVSPEAVDDSIRISTYLSSTKIPLNLASRHREKIC